MANIAHPTAVQAEYDPARRRISLNRIFQIPQMFRPAVSSFANATIGHLNLERPAIGLTAIAAWFRGAPWRGMSPTERRAAGKRGDRDGMYRPIVEKERLNPEPMDFWEFGVFRG